MKTCIKERHLFRFVSSAPLTCRPGPARSTNTAVPHHLRDVRPRIWQFEVTKRLVNLGMTGWVTLLDGRLIDGEQPAQDDPAWKQWVELYTAGRFAIMDYKVLGRYYEIIVDSAELETLDPYAPFFEVYQVVERKVK